MNGTTSPTELLVTTNVMIMKVPPVRCFIEVTYELMFFTTRQNCQPRILEKVSGVAASTEMTKVRNPGYSCNAFMCFGVQTDPLVLIHKDAPASAHRATISKNSGSMRNSLTPWNMSCSD